MDDPLVERAGSTSARAACILRAGQTKSGDVGTVAESGASETRRLARSVTRPVSNVTFSLEGARPFERAIGLASAWMAARNPAIPPEASHGAPFDVGGAGTPVARAAVLDYEDGRVWSATIDDPDAKLVGRTWITEFTIAEYRGGAHFGSRLLNFTRGDDQTFIASVPRLVRDLVTEMPCVADGEVLSESGRLVETPDELDAMLALLERLDRRLPVVALAAGRDREPRVPMARLATRLTGAAHVIGITNDCAELLTRRVGRALSVFNGAVRMYRPGLCLDDADPFEHPLWVAHAGRESGEGDMVVAQVLASGLAAPTTEYPRFDAVRRAAIENAVIARRARGAAGEPDVLRLLEDQNAALRADLQRVADEQNQWLADAEVTRTSAERQIAELRADLHRSRAQNDALRAALEGSGSAHASRTELVNLDQFGIWAAANLSPRIWISPKAVKETERHGQYRAPREIGDALVALDDLYAKMKGGAGPDAKRAWEERATALGISVSPCFAREGDLKRFPEYAVQYRDEKRWCDLHLKRGGGADPKSMFRIYFLWDEDEERLVVGHMPSHLDNNLTN